MESFGESMRRKRQMVDEIERRRQAHGRLERGGQQTEAELTCLESDLQSMEHHRQRLETRVDSLKAKLGQVHPQSSKSASALTELTNEFEALMELERQSMQKCIDLTKSCFGCGLPAHQLTWTWVEFFDARRVSGWRAVCLTCQDDVAFFEVE